MSAKEIFCNKPFRELSLEQENIKLCCYMPGGAIPKVGPQKAWNHPKAQEIRRTVLEGTFEYCQNCPLYRDQIQDARLPHYRLVLDRGPQHLAISNDPTCNLACPSCRERPKQISPAIGYVVLGEQLQYLGHFHRSLRSLEVSTMGDPFGSHSYNTLLRLLDPQDFPNLKIALHTNGLLMKNSWPQMRILHNPHVISFLLQSIDAATKKTYEINRRGGKWERLIESLDFLHQLRKEGHQFPWFITMVVQANNWQEIPAFIALGKTYEVDAINLTWLTNWRYTHAEYRQRAVHLPNHPEHAALLLLLDQFRPIPRLRKTKDAFNYGEGNPVIEMRPLHTVQR